PRPRLPPDPRQSTAMALESPDASEGWEGTPRAAKGLTRASVLEVRKRSAHAQRRSRRQPVAGPFGVTRRSVVRQFLEKGYETSRARRMAGPYHDHAHG